MAAQPPAPIPTAPAPGRSAATRPKRNAPSPLTRADVQRRLRVFGYLYLIGVIQLWVMLEMDVRMIPTMPFLFPGSLAAFEWYWTTPSYSIPECLLWSAPFLAVALAGSFSRRKGWTIAWTVVFGCLVVMTIALWTAEIGS